MAHEQDSHDDERDDDLTEDNEAAGARAAGGVPNWTPRMSFDLSGLYPDLTDIIRRALPDPSELVKFKLPPEAFPKINLPERIFPAIDVSGLFPMPDLSGLLPVIDTSGIMTRFNFSDLAAQIESGWAKNFGPIVDMTAFIPKIVIPELDDAFKAMLERLREQLPPNWPEGIDFNAATTVIEDDGLPIVWVPRADIVETILNAPDREARVKILLDRSEDVIQDCRDVIATIDHPTLTNQIPLVARVVDAFAAGHVESAQALAVVVTETVVARTLDKDYKKVQKLVQFDPHAVSLGEVRVKAALAPIGPFYTAWWPSSGDPAPTALSRHVTVHQADVEHYTPGNAIVAVMLATSVLRAMQDFMEA